MKSDSGRNLQIVAVVHSSECVVDIMPNMYIVHCTSTALPFERRIGDWLQLNIVYIVFIMYLYVVHIYPIVFAQCIYALSRNRE